MDNPVTHAPLKPSDKAIAVGLLALLAVGEFMLLPFLSAMMAMLVALAANTMVFLAEIAVLVFVALLVVTNGTNLLYGFLNFSQGIRKFIIRENPVGTLDTAIARLGKKQDDIAQALADSKASQLRLANRIRSRTRDGALDKAEAEEALAMAAKKAGKPDTECQQHAVAADRWRHQAETFQPMLDRLKKMQETLGKARELAEAKLADLQNQRDVLVTQLDAEKDGQKAVGSFKRFFGRSPELTMAGFSIEEIERQTTQAEAEIDQFLEDISPKLEEADLKKQAQADAAMARFNSFAADKLPQKALPSAPAVAPVLGAVKDGVVVEDGRRVH